MSKKGNRLEIWAAGIVLTVSGLLAVIVGLPTYMRATATPLHPQPQSAPSVTQSEPPPQWSEAVGRSRQIMRAGLAEQNLPGLSVAIGVGGDIVWAEGFGWADIEKRVPVTPDTHSGSGMVDTGAESATEENSEHVGEPAEDAPFLTFFRQVILEPLGMGGTKVKYATGETADRRRSTSRGSARIPTTVST